MSALPRSNPGPGPDAVDLLTRRCRIFLDTWRGRTYARPVTQLAAGRARLREWLLSGTPPIPAGIGEAEALVEAAREQKLAGLLYSAINGAGTAWPENSRDLLKERYQHHFVQGVAQLELAGRVQNLLAVAGLRAVPLKGAAVSLRLYDSEAERPMGDVDLLLLDSWDDALPLLARAGLTEEHRADHAWSFCADNAKTVLELHHSLTSPPGFYPIDSEGIWQRTVLGSGLVGRLPSSEDLLVHLALHAAFQHGFALSLVQYLDFRRLLEREPLNTDLLLTVAKDARAEAPLAAALQAASAIVGAHVDEGLARELSGRIPRGLAEWLRARLKEPLSLVTPGPPTVAFVRWELAYGRRLSFLKATLSPQFPGIARSPWRRAISAVARGGSLLGGWGWRTLRAGRGAR